MRIPSDAVDVHLGAGTASLSVSNQHVHDYGNIPNALNNGASAPATVSYTIHWHDVKRRRQVHNDTLHVAGLFLDTDAHIQWTGHNEATGITFTSNDKGQNAVVAQIGHERNGVFFS